MATNDGAAESGSGGIAKSQDFSETNVQVEGVDEADIVKTDGDYIYTISGDNLVIIRASPPNEAEVLSETTLGNFTPSQIFIEDDNLMIFGYTQYIVDMLMTDIKTVTSGSMTDRGIWYPSYYYKSMATVQLWDISNREDPEISRTVDFEGNYIASRKIGDKVYFAVNSYPEYEVLEAEDVLPEYRDSESGSDEFVPSCGCEDVAYFNPWRATSYITLVAMSIDDEDADIEKEVILGSGQNVYASLENFYITEYDYWGGVLPMQLLARDLEVVQEPKETTIVHKFYLDGMDIGYVGNAEVPGHVLNQFSMDEHEGNFRIAMTQGRLTRDGSSTTSNNIYIYDEDMDLIGSLLDLAPGESIYSARFLGDRGYLVTFKKIDPFFVIDLSDPTNPEVLGKLKIPGYSDYLHPYDENHIIGIGKDTLEAAEERGDFVWYQGVKMALFDVTDVSNPIEVSKVNIGDRGTDSEVLRDHKAFLFDREKNLLVLPILLAEIKGDPEDLPDWSYGDYVYQGAYVYSLTPEDGFELKGRITHYDDEDVFEKSGYYFYGYGYNVRRSLYIGDYLYTLSDYKLKANRLADLEELVSLTFGDPEEPKYYIEEEIVF
jgi:inhibitor of cysteine peptidase